MTTSTSHDQERLIPLNQLSLSPLNVRTTGADQGIEELAALILAQSLLQNLVVHEEGTQGRRHLPSFRVVAGGRRWRALQLLAKRKAIPIDFAVRCLVVSVERAVEISLAENSGRQAMHPADQFAAFRTLVDAGQSVEEVAARFGVAPLVVQRRLKLANVCPEFFALYREGQITLEHLMAFAVTDDHAKQQQVWQSLKPYDRHPATLRRALTEHEVPVSAPMVRFVGLKAYEKAGGGVRRDLFAEKEEGFAMDPELLQRLATEKLNKTAAAVRSEGLTWVEVIAQPDYAARAAYKRALTVLREPTAEEQAQLDTLQARRAQIEQQYAEADEDEEQLEALNEQAEEIDAALDGIREQRAVPHPDQQALAGALVSIGRDGKVQIERGLLRPEDAKRLTRSSGAADCVAGAQPPRVHSAALVRRLTAHRTLALQATLAQRTDVALVALAHRLVLEEFFIPSAWRESVLQIDLHEPALGRELPDIDSTPAQAALERQREALRVQLPKDSEHLLGWLLHQPQAQVLALLAFCVARAVDGVRAEEGAGPIDALATAAGLDMRQWWSPTVENYFGSVPRARVLEVVREAVSPEVAAALATMKKAPLTKAAEERLVGTGWLPALLQTAIA